MLHLFCSNFVHGITKTLINKPISYYPKLRFFRVIFHILLFLDLNFNLNLVCYLKKPKL